MTDAVAPGYSAVVRHPRDLGTIARHLRRGRYGFSYEAWHDLRTVWANCRLYNEGGTPIVDMCDALEAKAQAAWDEKGLPHSGEGLRWYGYGNSNIYMDGCGGGTRGGCRTRVRGVLLWRYCDSDKQVVNIQTSELTVTDSN